MSSENLAKYLEAARQRRLDEQEARKQQLTRQHEARRANFDGRSEPLNVYVVRVPKMPDWASPKLAPS